MVPEGISIKKRLKEKKVITKNKKNEHKIYNNRRTNIISIHILF